MKTGQPLAAAASIVVWMALVESALSVGSAPLHMTSIHGRPEHKRVSPEAGNELFSAQADGAAQRTATKTLRTLRSADTLVVPAKAGTQGSRRNLQALDSRLRGNDAC